jgi:hypothetical protein
MSHLVRHVGRLSEFERIDDPRPGRGVVEAMASGFAGMEAVTTWLWC